MQMWSQNLFGPPQWLEKWKILPTPSDVLGMPSGDLGQRESQTDWSTAASLKGCRGGAKTPLPLFQKFLSLKNF